MTLDDLALEQEATNLGIPATTYIIKFFEIRGHLEAASKEEHTNEWYNLQAAVRTRNYYQANNKTRE